MSEYLIDVYDDFSEEEIAKQTTSVRNVWNAGKEVKEVAEKVEKILGMKVSDLQYYCWPQVFETTKPFGDGTKHPTMFTIECFVHPESFECCMVLEGRIQHREVFEKFLEYDLVEIIKIENLIFEEAENKAYRIAHEKLGGGDIILEVKNGGSSIEGFIFRATKKG